MGARKLQGPIYGFSTTQFFPVNVVWGLNVVPRAFLQLNQPPTPCVRIVHVLGHARHPNRIRHQLHLILHASSQLVRLCVAVHVHLLRAACDDEHGYFSRLQHSCGQYVHVSNVEDAPVRLQACRGVLLGQRGVDLELRGREPQLERVGVAFDVSIQHFGEDVFAHFSQKWLDLKRRVHLSELFYHLGRFVFGEEAGHSVCDATSGGDKRILRLVVR